MSPSDPIAAELVAPAMAARENGEHYNGFKVGCIGYHQTDDGSVCRFEGANTKPTPHSKKDCAEMKVMRAADHAGVILRGLVVVGQPRVEDDTLTLHPCEACRELMRYYIKKRRVIESTTSITCVNALTAHVEDFTVAELFVAHGEFLDEG
jgi:cytidine deaminase